MRDIFLRVAQNTYGKAGLLVMVGAGFYFSWLDALFTGYFFPLHRGAAESEIGALLVFAVSALVALITFFRSQWMRDLISRNSVAVASALAGSLGSGLMIISDSFAVSFLVALGAVLSGWFVAYFQFCWCAAFCKYGKKTALPFVVGSVSLSIVFDAFPVLMHPLAAAVVIALFPLASLLLLSFEDRSFRVFDEAKAAAISATDKPFSSWKSAVGMSPMLLCSFAFLFLGFGYLQHLMSFAPIVGVESALIVLIVRGATALLLFFVLVVFSWRQTAVYRIGLIAIIAGCMVSSLVSGQASLVPYCVIMAGLTVFNLIIYVAFSQVAYTESADSCKTIAAMWIITGVGMAAGAGAGLLSDSLGLVLLSQRPQVPIVVGYLIAIATVLLLSTEDIWIVLSLNHTPDNASRGNDELLEAYLRQEGLTSRESEVAMLLEQGRTQTWIAGYLTISESTVATHVRHIYQKLSVHNRQEFLDICRSEVLSSKSNDRQN